MNILILSNDINGLYRFRKELVQELSTIGSVTISVPTKGVANPFKEMKCTVIDTTISRRGKNPLKDLKLLNEYKKIIRGVKPDVVLTYTIKPNIYGGIACQKCHVPYLPNVTGLGDSIENKSLTQKVVLCLYKKGLKKAQAVFFQNEANKEFFFKLGIAKNNGILLPGSGVNLEENNFESYLPETDKIVFVTIGRVVRDKGIYELIEAAKELKSKHANLIFRVIGPIEDADCKVLLDTAVSNGLIEFLGPRNDVHDLIKNSHATIHPSYHEGTSNVLLETAACGRPVIATNVPGCINTFDNSISGIAFEPKNVDSLVTAIESFLSLPYFEKVQMGKMGRNKVEKEFSRRIVIDKYLHEIERCNKIKED